MIQNFHENLKIIKHFPEKSFSFNETPPNSLKLFWVNILLNLVTDDKKV